MPNFFHRTEKRIPDSSRIIYSAKKICYFGKVTQAIPV